MKREQLITSLKRIQKRLCSYTKQPCDCKFMRNEDTDICNGHENGSGCPELFVVIQLLEIMSSNEFVKIAKRAKMYNYFDDVPRPQKHEKAKINKEDLKVIVEEIAKTFFNNDIKNRQGQ
jgi:hypothetical protein